MLEESWDKFVALADYSERMSDEYIMDLGYYDWCAPKEIKSCSASVLNRLWGQKFLIIRRAEGFLLRYNMIYLNHHHTSNGDNNFLMTALFSHLVVFN